LCRLHHKKEHAKEKDPKEEEVEAGEVVELQLAVERCAHANEKDHKEEEVGV